MRICTEVCVNGKSVRIDASSCILHRGSGGTCAPVVYVIDEPAHPVDLTALAAGRESNVVGVPVRDWGCNLTPWPAPGLYRGEPDFGGRAYDTLAELCERTIPEIERDAGLRPAMRAICGYSLAGLFALFALMHGDAFSACACISGSVWYEGWVEHLRARDVDLAGRYAFLSIGTKEKRAARPILHAVQDNMEDCARILEDHGCAVRYQTSPGGHLQFVSERFDTGISALDEWLSARQSK